MLTQPIAKGQMPCFCDGDLSGDLVGHLLRYLHRLRVNMTCLCQLLSKGMPGSGTAGKIDYCAQKPK